MNLQELVNHRSTCLIHQAPMTPFSFNKGLALDVIEEGLLVVELADQPPYKKAVFRYNGTFTKDKGMNKVFRAPFFVMMACEKCQCAPIHKSRGLGHTTLLDIKSIHHYYSFSLMADAQGNYDGHLNNETLKYHKEDKFYHLDVDLQTKHANFKMGTNAGYDILEHLLEGFMSIDIPNLDVTRITSLDQMIDKFKLYNLFS
jgi:hypothetical protein